MTFHSTMSVAATTKCVVEVVDRILGICRKALAAGSKLTDISLNAWFEHKTESGRVGQRADERKLVHDVTALKPPLFAAVVRMLERIKTELETSEHEYITKHNVEGNHGSRRAAGRCEKADRRYHGAEAVAVPGGAARAGAHPVWHPGEAQGGALARARPHPLGHEVEAGTHPRRAPSAEGTPWSCFETLSSIFIRLLCPSRV